MLCNLLATARFRKIRSLGHGATSRVFEVEDRTNGGRFALKQLRDERLSVERIARFKDEFRALERVSHPNVAKVYELLADDAGVYLLMELVEGVDFISYVRLGSSSHVHASYSASPAASHTASLTEGLHERASERSLPEDAERGHLNVERLRDALAQLASGLRALHATGSIHCDIKPQNVLVNHDGRVVIVDFGLLTEAAQEKRWRGTPAFMAPEQFGGVYTEATDWYAVGMLLYAALCDRFSVEDTPDTLARARHAARPADPRLWVHGLPNDLVELALWLLEPDPVRRPGGESIARILGADQKFPPVHRLAPRFIGRASELENLNAAFASVQRDRARVVHIHGESGIGKTSLLRRFASTVEDREGVVFHGACYRDASVPYKALDTIMDRIAVRLASLELAFDGADRAALALMFPVFGAGHRGNVEMDVHDPLLIRARAVMAFRKLLAQLAERRGIVLCIDDMQWTDLESIELLQNLLHPPAPPGLLLVLSYRSVREGWGPRVEIVRQHLPPDEDLALGPLDMQAVQALVETSVTAGAQQLAAIWRESGGNPFFVGELVRSRSTDHDTISLGAVLSSRISTLAPKYQPYLELVSVASRPVEERVLRRALGITQEALLETRWVLIADSLVRAAEEEEGRSVEPYHDRIREHLLDGLAPERLRARHSLLAEAYEGEEAADPEILGFHYRRAGNVEKALLYTERAADAAAHALAFDRAAELYDVALQHAEQSARLALLVKHANALSNAGRSAGAAKAFRDALAYRPEDLELQLRAGEEYLKAGLVDSGLALLFEVAEAIGQPIPRNRASAILTLAWHELKLRWLRVPRVHDRDAGASDQQRLAVCITIARQLLMVDPLLGAVFQRRYLAMALSVGSRTDVVHALAIETGFSAMLSSAVGSIQRAEKLYELASALCQPSDAPFTRGLLFVARGTIELAVGNWRASRAAHEAAAEIYRDKMSANLRWDVAYCQNLLLPMFWFDADFGALRERLQRYMLEASTYRLVETLQTLWGAGKLALLRDDPTEARRIIAETMAKWPPEPWRPQHFIAALLLVEVSLYEGKYDGATRQLGSAWRRSWAEGFHLLRINQLLVRVTRARLAIALGSLREAERDIRVLERCCGAFGEGLANVFAACVLAARGERQRAARLFDAAIPVLDAQGAALFAIAAQHRLAVLRSDRRGEQVALGVFRERGVQAPEKFVHALLPLASTDGRSS